MFLLVFMFLISFVCMCLIVAVMCLLWFCLFRMFAVLFGFLLFYYVFSVNISFLFLYIYIYIYIYICV